MMRSFFRLAALCVLGAVLLAPSALKAQVPSGYMPEVTAPWMSAYGLSGGDEPSALPAAVSRPPAARGVAGRGKSRSALPALPSDQAALPHGAHAPTLPPVSLPLSPLEEAYAQRIVERLGQFGYEVFGQRSSAHKMMTGPRRGMPAGVVQDDFVLGGGDRLAVMFRGQRKDSAVYEINTQGLLLVDDLRPVSAAGRTIGQVRAELQAQLDDQHNTEIFVSLDSVRQIDVLVLGHVHEPGRQSLTVFDSVLDALMAAGGVDKTGSLRQIRLVRGGRSTLVDLYGLLVHGSTAMDLALRDGDRIIVPPLGPTMAVAGGVRRPAIYEILPGLQGMRHRPHESSSKLSLEEVLTMAGGVASPGQNRFIRLSLTGDGRETVDDVADGYDKLFGDGSILMVAPSAAMRSDMVELAGHTRKPGMHALERSPTLAALLGDRTVFGDDIYPLIGVLERWNPERMARELSAFSPLLVMQEQFDRRLQDGDVVHLFSRRQIAALQDGGQDQDGTAPDREEAGSRPPDRGIDEEFMIDDPVLRSFLRERSLFVRGAVRAPGGWPVAEGASLDNVLAVAGGLTLEASTRNIEVTSALQGQGGQAHGRSGTRRVSVDITETSPAHVKLAAGDSVRVNQKFLKVDDSSVLLIGEVRHPGRYDLLPGDTMSDLLARAGGLSDQAYPAGAIFSRHSERKAEQARFQAAARDLEQALARAINQDRDKMPDSAQLALAQDLAAELRQAEAVGRITVEADPAVLAAQPELDILLEAGDRIYIPRRPLNVRVSGEVLSPASLQFRSNKNPRDYIAESGGFTYHADKSRTFVLYPDGSAQPLLVNSWNHAPVFIPPGSTIVVPRDPKPFDFIESARDISQILSNLAITAIFLNDIRD